MVQRSDLDLGLWLPIAIGIRLPASAWGQMRQLHRRSSPTDRGLSLATVTEGPSIRPGRTAG